MVELVSWVEPLLLTDVSTLTSAEESDNPGILRTPLCRGLGAIGTVALFIGLIRAIYPIGYIIRTGE